MLGQALLASLLALGAPAGDEQLETLLAQPLSVGNVAQLILHAQDPRASARWIEALRDPRPGVRAASARTIGVVGARLAAAALETALTSEQDPLARLEMRRAQRILNRTKPDTLPVGKGGSIHTASGLWPELVAEVLRACDCKPAGDALAAAFIVYGRGGRARNVEVLDTLLRPECARAARVLLALSLSPAAPEASPRALVVLPLDADWVACAAGPDPRAKSPAAEAARTATADDEADLLPTKRLRVGGQIREPKKLRSVSPVYPTTAKAARRQGVVVIETVIAPSGCAGDLRVLRSAGLDLDLAAVKAVKGWRYTPTLLGGVAVPVIMTVTVNFKLN